MSADPIVIVSYARTPMGGFQGALAGASATQLGAAAVRAAVERAGVSPDSVEQIFMGCVLPAGLGQALDHLASLGHREIAFIGGPRDVPSAEIIRNQLEAAVAGRGLHLSCRLECNYRTDGGWAAVRSLICQQPSASAILCGNDLIALGAISALEQMGIDVPSQMSVVGHDDLLIARLARPPLTTIRVSSEEIGRKAFESLAELVRNPDSEGEPIPIPGRLVIRKSTAPAPVETTSPPSLPD